MAKSAMDEETHVKGVDDYHSEARDTHDIDSEDEYQPLSDGKLKNSSKIFVGNLPFSAGKTELEKLFEEVYINLNAIYLKLLNVFASSV